MRQAGAVTSPASITVDPAVLRRTARVVQATCAEARRLQRAAGILDIGVTGSVELADALARHARTWSWTVEIIEDRVREVADLLATAGQVYDQVEECIADLTGAPARPAPGE